MFMSFFHLINTKKKELALIYGLLVVLRHIHRNFMYMCAGGQNKVDLRLGSQTHAIEISQGSPIQHRHRTILSVLPRPPPPKDDPYGQDSDNNGQIHCANGVKTYRSRLLRCVWGYQGSVLLNPGSSRGTNNYKSDRRTDINIYWSQTKIIQNFKFNFRRNDHENAFSKKITHNKMRWTLNQLGHVIVHMTSCLWRHDVFIRPYKPMKVAMEIL